MSAERSSRGRGSEERSSRGKSSGELDFLIHEAADWLRIPSISAGARNDAALLEAAQWAQRRVLDAGGECELVDTPGGAPLVVGELRAAREDAPTVLIYGHYDVQDPGDDALWTTPPFEPDIRDGRLWARGASDDKGNFLPLLHVACAMAEAGELGVHVRVLVEGAEETGGTDVNDWVEADERGADCAIVFDAPMLDPETPALTVATRGMVFAHLTVRTGERPAHSGIYGGAALNAMHALHTVLAAVLPGPDGRLPEPLRAGVEPPTSDERAAWDALPAGADLLARGRRAARRQRRGRGVLPAHDGRRVARRAPPRGRRHAHDRPAGRALRPVRAPRARPGPAGDRGGAREPAARSAARRRRARAQDRARLAVELRPRVGRVSRIARGALARSCGREPVLLRTGGTLPILASFAERGIPVVVSGFALPQDNLHAPDESDALASLELGRRAARALYEDLSALRPVRP